MTTKTKISNDESHVSEIFCILWLDDNVKSDDNRDTEQSLRSIINRFKRFNNSDHCADYILNQSPDDRVILIVSGTLGRILVPKLNKVRQLISIYIYCMNVKRNKEWSKPYAKVKGVVSELDKLVARIKGDHKIQQIIEQPFSINIFAAGKSTGGVNGKFVFSQVLIECLLRLKPMENDTHELINYCKKVYEGNRYELANIREFERTYSSDKALWWYTRDTFFFKLLNSILRTENIHMIYLFRQYMADLQQQLKKNQTRSVLKVYRGQFLSSDELETLKKSCGLFISINSFFSTSTEYDRACTFINEFELPDDIERVLFIIEADPNRVTVKPFANISRFSEYEEENEILFMVGSIFRLENVSFHSHEKLWKINMKLSNENDSDFKNVLKDMKQELGTGETTLQVLANVLCEMGQFDLAEFYLHRLLAQIPSNHPSFSDLYHELSKIASRARDYDKSVEYRQKALEFNKKSGQASSKTNIDEKETKHKPDSVDHSSKPKPKVEPNLVLPKTWPTFRHLGLEIISPKNTRTIVLDNEEAHVKILVRTPPEVLLLGTLEENNGQKIFGADRVFYDRHKNLWKCYFAPKNNGKYDITIYAKERNDPRNYTSACSFILEATRITPFPVLFANTSQLFYDLDLEIEAPHDRYTIPWTKGASSVEIRIRSPNDVYLSCNLKTNGTHVENATLSQYDEIKNNWQLLFAPQQTGSHELWVYARRENDTSSTSKSVVSFNLNAFEIQTRIQFPQIYSEFHRRKCRIITPLNGILKKGSKVRFHCNIPGARDVDVFFDSQFSHGGGYTDPVFDRTLTVGSGKIGIYAKFGSKELYEGMVTYTVQ